MLLTIHITALISWVARLEGIWVRELDAQGTHSGGGSCAARLPST